MSSKRSTGSQKRAVSESGIPFHPDPKFRGILYTIQAGAMQSTVKPIHYIMPCRVGVVGGVSAADVYIANPAPDETPIFLNVGNDPDTMSAVGRSDPFFLDLIRTFVTTAVDLENENPCDADAENQVCLLVRNADVYGPDQVWDGCGFRCTIGAASHNEFAKRFQQAFPAGMQNVAPLPGFAGTRH